MRKIALVTVARSDWGIYRSVVAELAHHSEIDLTILASGMHLSDMHGSTVRLVEADAKKLSIDVRRVPMTFSSDAPVDVALAMGEGVSGFGVAYRDLAPDLVVVLGDRFEMFCAVAAAVPFVLPVFHIHGGERTAGAIDDALRHAMTKLSHFHFVSTREYGRRVRQLGEDAWRIVVSGAPALDSLPRTDEGDIDSVAQMIGADLTAPYLLVAFHPTTLEPGDADEQGKQVLAAVEASGMLAILMMPNADPGGLAIRSLFNEACSRLPAWRSVENLTFEQYVLLMANAQAMVGNSSSGLIEAPSTRTAVINVGRRQEGRIRGSNVIDATCAFGDIHAAIGQALTPDWRKRALTGENPYAAGGAARRVVDACISVPLDRRLKNKGFVDGPIEHLRPIADVSVYADVSIREAMICIDRNRCGIVVVIDPDSRLVGVVTDGDVRRGIIEGKTLDTPLRDVMKNKKPAITASWRVTNEKAIVLMRAKEVRHLPVIRNGRVAGILLLDDLIDPLM